MYLRKIKELEKALRKRQNDTFNKFVDDFIQEELTNFDEFETYSDLNIREE